MLGFIPVDKCSSHLSPNKLPRPRRQKATTNQMLETTSCGMSGGKGCADPAQSLHGWENIKERRREPEEEEFCCKIASSSYDRRGSSLQSQR